MEREIIWRGLYMREVGMVALPRVVAQRAARAFKKVRVTIAEPHVTTT